MAVPEIALAWKNERLAIEGGDPVRRTPLPPWPVFAEDEIAAAAAVLRSGKVNYWTGEEARAFERELAEAFGTRHAIATSNGTAALEMCLHAIGIEAGAGDEVIVPSRTFVATGSAVAFMGARPVFADVDRDSGNVTRETIAAVIGPRTRAVVVVHLGGWPAELGPIAELCRAHDLKLIEDCAQAHGAALEGQRIGSIGDIAAFSFCQDKIMTTGGEGGMVVTSDASLWRRAWAYKDHGKSWAAVYEREHPPGFRWLHESIGTNARMTEPQAAIGRVQLRKLGAWSATRRHHHARLAARLGALPGLRVPVVPPGRVHAAYRFYAYVRPEALRPGWDRDRVMAAIEAEGIPCRVGSCGEIYGERAFTDDERPPVPHPVARELFETSLAFLVHPTLSDGDIDDTITAVEKVLAHAQHG